MTESDSLVIDVNSVLKNLAKFNDIQYVAYRTASKIQALQRAFYLDKLPCDVLAGICKKHNLNSTENAVKLTFSELSVILEDIYFVVSQTTSLNSEFVTNLLCKFLVLVLQKEDGVELLSFKTILTVLCGSKPRDKYSYLFTELADHNSVLTARRLELLLQRLVLLTDFIGEGHAFGKSLIPETVRSCFESSSMGTLGISFQGFIDWLSRDPQLLVWLSTLHRLHLSESVVHDVKCSVCKVIPMCGLRYRCLRCLTYNLCQTCFFTGKISRSHKKAHPVQEYCYESTARQSLKALLATLGNKIRRSSWKLQYLPAERKLSYLEETTLQLDNLEESTKALGSCSTVSPADLESVINELEEHNRRLEQYADHVKTQNVKKFLQTHRFMMEKQVARLRAIKNQLIEQQRGGAMAISTPFGRTTRMHGSAISPITSNSLPLTWDKYDIDEPLVSVLQSDEGDKEGISTCILKWKEDGGYSSNEMKIQPSHNFSWLRSECNSDKSDQVPNEEMKVFQEELDEILAKLQDLLSKQENDAPHHSNHTLDILQNL